MSRRIGQEYFEVPPIPKVIHQVWLPNWMQVPANIRHTRAAWINLNPTWKYQFWGLREVERLLQTSFRFLKPVWDALGEERIVKRADLARLMILQAEGGLYADMDLLPVLPLRINSTLTEKYIVCQEHDPSGEVRICNGFLAAPRNSQSILELLSDCAPRVHYPVLEFLGPRVVSPFFLSESTKVLPWQVILSTKPEIGALCLNLNSRSWGEVDAGQEWYRC